MLTAVPGTPMLTAVPGTNILAITSHSLDRCVCVCCFVVAESVCGCVCMPNFCCVVVAERVCVCMPNFCCVVVAERESVCVYA